MTKVEELGFILLENLGFYSQFLVQGSNFFLKLANFFCLVVAFLGRFRYMQFHGFEYPMG